MPYCTYCGEWMEENHKFCTNCGAPREESEASYRASFYGEAENESRAASGDRTDAGGFRETPYFENSEESERHFERRRPDEIPYAPNPPYGEPGYGGFPAGDFFGSNSDRHGILWGIFSFFFPFIGVFLAIFWRKTRPETVKMIIAGIFLSMLSLIAF